MKKITAERDDIAFYIKVTALITITPETKKKARQIVCSRSFEVLQGAMEKKPVTAPDCPTSEVDENIKFMEENGIGGVPAIVFPDGSINEGFLDAARLLARIEEARKTRGQGR